MKKERFHAVQALRFICFLGVFFDHVGIPALIENRFLVLTVFYLISGFMMVYSYADRELSCSPRDCALFSIGKIRKLYPLHVETTLLQYLMQTVFYLSFGYPLLKVLTGNKSLPRLGVNLLLMQAWVPNVREYVLSFNGPAWFLSTMLFLYFLFPRMLRMIRKLNSSAKLLAVLAGTMAAGLLLISVVGYRTGFEEEIFLWITQYFPLTRAIDFFAGCVLGYLFLQYRQSHSVQLKGSSAVWTAAEIAVLVIVFLFDYKKLTGSAETVINGNVFLKVMVKSPCVLSVLAAVPLILIFVWNRGAITKALCRKPILYLGDITMYMYLLHYLFISAWDYIEMATGYTARGWVKFIVVLSQFVLTVLSGVLYDRFVKRQKAAKKPTAS